MPARLLRRFPLPSLPDYLPAHPHALFRLWVLLLQYWGPPVPTPLPEGDDSPELQSVRAAATAANLASRVHQADIASRALLGAALDSVQQVWRGGGSEGR